LDDSIIDLNNYLLVLFESHEMWKTLQNVDSLGLAFVSVLANLALVKTQISDCPCLVQNVMETWVVEACQVLSNGLDRLNFGLKVLEEGLISLDRS
jgi:hypothetical protein